MSATDTGLYSLLNADGHLDVSQTYLVRPRHRTDPSDNAKQREGKEFRAVPMNPREPLVIHVHVKVPQEAYLIALPRSA